MSICLLVITMMTKASHTAAHRNGKIHFQDSSEIDADERYSTNRNRNHRGRSRIHNKHINVTEFEQGIPEVYPIRGPPQQPFITTTTQTPNYLTPASERQSIQEPANNPYAGNIFLSKLQTSTVRTAINKNDPPVIHGVPNQLPTSDKPVTTTTTMNPRRTDLLYGSNLFEESTNREGKVNEPTEVNFDERGLFDTAPHCQAGQILVNNRCRMAV